MPRIPTAPKELRTSGRRLWRAVQSEYELEEHERGLLLEMCRCLDMLDHLAAVVEEEGALIVDRFGVTKTHPALTESRQLKIAYARLSAALRLPSGESEGERRPQRRAGVRGTYDFPRAVS